MNQPCRAALNLRYSFRLLFGFQGLNDGSEEDPTDHCPPLKRMNLSWRVGIEVIDLVWCPPGIH